MLMYKFSISDEEPIRYLFETSAGVVYEVRFRNTPYLFDDLPYINQSVYEMIIGRLAGSPAKTPSDSAIPMTVAAICEDFFARQQGRIVLFICDSSDGRQLIRARKFRDWFFRFNDANYIKLNAKIIESATTYSLISLVFSLRHPHLDDIVKGFQQLTKPYSAPK
jgi:hypothetical protein